MNNNSSQVAYSALIELFNKQGYVLFDDIVDFADEFDMPISDIDRLTTDLNLGGVVILEERPGMVLEDSSDKYRDFAQLDYDELFSQILTIEPSLVDFIEYIKHVKPAQANELDSLKYQIVEGNEFAKNRFIEVHLRAALRIAFQRYTLYNCELFDTIQDACIGLVQAVNNYNPDENGNFSGYAAMWMLQSISRNQSTQRPLVYYPVHKKEDYFNNYQKLKDHGCLECNELSHCKKVREMIVSNYESSQAIEDVINMSTPIESLDGLMEHEETEYKFYYTDDYILDHAQRINLHYRLINILSCLDDRTRRILQYRYGVLDENPRTLEEIGQIMGVTRERVRQIENKALVKCRKACGVHTVPPES